MGASIEPRKPAPHNLDRHRAFIKIKPVQIGNLQLAAPRGRKVAGTINHRLIVEIQARYRVVRFGQLGLFLDRHRLAVRIKFHHAERLGIIDPVSKHARPATARIGIAQQCGQAVAVEDIIAEDQRAWPPAHKIRADVKRLCQPFRLRLHFIGQRHPEIRPIAQHPLKLRGIFGRGDNQNLADPRQHQRAQRIIDHRLVKNRHQLLGNTARQRVKPRARTARQDDAPPVRIDCHSGLPLPL